MGGFVGCIPLGHMGSAKGTIKLFGFVLNRHTLVLDTNTAILMAAIGCNSGGIGVTNPAFFGIHLGIHLHSNCDFFDIGGSKFSGSGWYNIIIIIIEIVGNDDAACIARIHRRQSS